MADTPLTGVPVTPAPVAPVAAKPVDPAKDQAVLKDLSNVVKSGASEAEQQKAFGKAFDEKEGEDSFRRAARLEREREALMNAGDPTKDPVAKQKAMDLNTVAPGAQADAAKIKKIGADAAKNS